MTESRLVCYETLFIRDDVMPENQERAISLRSPEFRTALVGRADELARLLELVARGGHAVTIVGPPGVGKSRLAWELGRTLVAQGHAFSLHAVDVSQVTDETEVLIATLCFSSEGYRGDAQGRGVTGSGRDTFSLRERGVAVRQRRAAAGTRAGDCAGAAAEIARDTNGGDLTRAWALGSESDASD